MPNMLERMNLEGRTAAVVGGASGIGEAITRALAENGVAVHFCDVDAAAVAATATDLVTSGGDVVGTVADALDPAALNTFYDSIEAVAASLDIVVNVVGGVRQLAFADSGRAAWDGDIDRNFGYVLRSTQRAITLLRRGAPGGSIINLTTIEAHRGAAGFAVYTGAKAALTNYSRALAVELGAEAIRVNCVAPDTTPSQGNANALPADVLAQMMAAPELMGEAMKMYIPMGRPPAPDDIANAVLFLASDLSKSVTGTTVHVDGGTWAASGFINWPEGGWLPAAPVSVLRSVFGER